MLQSVASRDPDTPNPIGVIDGHGKLYTTTAVAVKTTGTTPATLAVTCTGPVWRPSASVVVASPAESVTDAGGCAVATPCVTVQVTTAPGKDRKSTRLNSSHVENSYAVFCLKKKNLLFSILPNHIQRAECGF